MARLVLLKQERYSKMADKEIKLQGSKMFRTFKTQKELSDYIEQHIPEEKRLLWLGVMFGMNFVANQVNETFDLKYKDTIKDKQFEIDADGTETEKDSIL